LIRFGWERKEKPKKKKKSQFPKPFCSWYPRSTNDEAAKHIQRGMFPNKMTTPKKREKIKGQRVRAGGGGEMEEGQGVVARLST
jgi:hypothetical protein